MPPDKPTNVLPPANGLDVGAAPLSSMRKRVSTWKLAFKPPPKSSVPLKMKREEPSAKPVAEPLPAVRPEYLVCAKPAFTLPDNVTEDWAITAPDAAKTAKATRVFFI